MSTKQLSIFDRYPSTPGYKAEGTSKQAAREMQSVAPTLRELVLAEIKRRPGTADEIAERLYKSPFAIRPRLSELAAETPPLVEMTTLRAKNRSGKWASIWKAI